VNREREAGEAPPQQGEIKPGRAMRYALVMLFGWIILGVVLATAMQYALGPAPPPRPAPRALAAVGAAPAAARPVKAAPPNTIVVAADAAGSFYVDGAVNGAPVRFLVDTGASFVALTPDDARAAGLSSSGGETIAIGTAHGDATAVKASLRTLRIDQLELENVPALVMDRSLPVSLLGMSFLSRLGGYSIRDGILTIEW
jgi:aspartyl protease family protein